jgi:large conductance mechanosensitive channel
MLKGFRNFIMRGNVVDLAVGVVIGGAFGTVVTSLVKDILTPLVGAIAKVPDFSGLVFTLNGSEFTYGAFLNALIAFLLVAASIYFFVIVPMNKLLARVKKGEEKTEVPADIQLLTEIRDLLKK